jgi:hypothetical protein
MIYSTISPGSEKLSYKTRLLVVTVFLLLPAAAGFFFGIDNYMGTASAQSVSINNTIAAPHASAMLDVDASNKGMLIPRVNLTSAADVTTIANPAVSLLVYNKSTAGVAPNNVVPGFYYWSGSKWLAFVAPAPAASTIAFSTGIILSGATMVSAAPRIMGFGNNTVQVINGLGESTMPPEMGGFSFTVPFAGTIKNLQVSADLLLASVAFINTMGLVYDFTVFTSPTSVNNGTDFLTSPYVSTALTTSLRFGFPNSVAVAGTFRSATNINTGSLNVNAGDRIGIRVRTRQSTDPSASDITQLSFNASFTYTPAQ